MTAGIASAKWANAKAARVGYLLGQGFNSPTIARQLDDGTKPALIRQMAHSWGLSLPQGRGNATSLTIHLDTRVRHKLERQADELGIQPAEFIRRIAVCAINDEMYDAIVDGAYA